MLGAEIPFEKFSKDTRVTFFTGAGISAESGIPTFRSTGGLWSKYDPVKLASPEGFNENPQLVLDWYAWRRDAIRLADPNPAHLSITKFQKLFHDSAVITQNVDSLHSRAGNNSVLELHGNIFRERCNNCGEENGLNSDERTKIRYCHCGGMLRPDVVWFGETLENQKLEQAFELTGACQIFFSLGTSTQVYPAAQLPFYAKEHGAYTIEINTERTPFSNHTDLFIKDAAGHALPNLYEEFYAAVS
ncbi:MAG: NAD-dependent deacylase [Candidatus Marinimicrobia bacterium]|nr:NAD-dependent deacylase [Candidatus Neomarinimicrobiota bacterium]